MACKISLVQVGPSVPKTISIILDFGFFWNLGHADITGQLISACHGLTSDQDMQRVSEFWVAYFRCSKVLCMPRSELRPGHAKGFGNFGRLP